MWCDDNEHDSEDWTALVGREGLTHVGNMTYGLFESMELEVKKIEQTFILAWQSKARIKEENCWR